MRLKQAQQPALDGSGIIVYRWYLWTTRGRIVTWAPTRAEARTRGEQRGLTVRRVTTAPPITLRVHLEEVDR